MSGGFYSRHAPGTHTDDEVRWQCAGPGPLSLVRMPGILTHYLGGGGASTETPGTHI
jgi:hypothetical protein